MIVDNAQIHCTELIQDFLAKNGRIMSIYLPSYSPN
ncbi:transposase [Geobacillus sp. 44B]|nr:transposase [Geobacillus sp. 44B]